MALNFPNCIRTGCRAAVVNRVSTLTFGANQSLTINGMQSKDFIPQNYSRARHHFKFACGGSEH